MRSVTPFDKVCGAGTNKFFVLKNVNAYPLKNSRGVVIVVGKGHSAGLFVAHQDDDRLALVIGRTIIDGTGKMGCHDIDAGAFLPAEKLFRRAFHHG